MNDYYVYGYFEPGSEQPFYIGKGRGRRARSHLGAFRTSKKGGLFYARLWELDAKGITPDVRILHEGLTDSDAKDKEIYLIERWGRIDIGTGCLCNHTRGGDGVGAVSAETRAKKSRAMTGRKFSAETRAKMSQVRRGKKLTAKADRNLRIFNADRMRPVDSYSLYTGQLVKTYTSINSTARDGFTPACVHGVCTWRGKAHKGLGWRYAE